MAGRGPAPKDPSVRARRNKPAGGDFRVVEIEPGEQPGLADLMGEVNPLTGEPWRDFTVDAWAELDGFPSTTKHLPAQWRRLAMALAYEEAGMLGKAPAGEGRLRMAAHFIDPADLMRGRILTVEADQAEKKQGKTPQPSADDDGEKPAAEKKVDPRLQLVAND